jgi:lipopolysaccharide assembly outer membrane protein LptD (OstA)
MDMLPQQEPEIERDLQETCSKIPLEIKEYFFRTCNDTIFNNLFDKYKRETGVDFQTSNKTSKWLIDNLNPTDFKVVLMIAQSEVMYGLEKDRVHNIHPIFKEEILLRHATEEIEKQILK